jgi:hypothetical protein
MIYFNTKNITVLLAVFAMGCGAHTKLHFQVRNMPKAELGQPVMIDAEYVATRCVPIWSCSFNTLGGSSPMHRDSQSHWFFSGTT